MSLEEELDREFRLFFDNFKNRNVSTSDMKVICKCLGKNTPWKQIKIELNFMILIVMTYILYNNCDAIAWFFSAIGKILLIQLLPYWDWTHLYNRNCLIENVKNIESSPYIFDDCTSCINGGNNTHLIICKF